jgi:hypothetical protein
MSVQARVEAQESAVKRALGQARSGGAREGCGRNYGDFVREAERNGRVERSAETRPARSNPMPTRTQVSPVRAQALVSLVKLEVCAARLAKAGRSRAEPFARRTEVHRTVAGASPLGDVKCRSTQTNLTRRDLARMAVAHPRRGTRLSAAVGLPRLISEEDGDMSQPSPEYRTPNYEYSSSAKLAGGYERCRNSCDEAWRQTTHLVRIVDDRRARRR